MKMHVRMAALAIGCLLSAGALAQQVSQNHVQEECRPAGSVQVPCKCPKQTKSLTCTVYRTSLGNKQCNKTCPVCACTPDGWVAEFIPNGGARLASSTLSDYLID
jgi:hypothetical protein